VFGVPGGGVYGLCGYLVAVFDEVVNQVFDVQQMRTAVHQGDVVHGE
jgi:hypothetical protein